MPITITEYPKDLLIELPWQATERGDHRVVVIPIEYRRDSRPEGEQEPTPRQRHAGSWTCAVAASDHPSYPVGGYRIIVSAAELARGKHIHRISNGTGSALDINVLEAKIKTPEMARKIAESIIGDDYDEDTYRAALQQARIAITTILTTLDDLVRLT